MTVFQYIEENTKLDRKITVTRSRTSSYQFHLLVRHYHQKLGTKVRFFAYAKATAGTTKGVIEEHSLIENKVIYALEGFGKQFTNALILPKNCHIVAETDAGELEAEPFSYKTKRGILKTLLQQLSLHLSLRELLKLDWNELECYEAVETELRRAKVLNSTEEDVAKRIGEGRRHGILAATKRGAAKEILEAIETMGAAGTADHFTRMLAQLIEYTAMRNFGMDAQRVAREMEIGYRRREELEEASKMITQSDMQTLANRLIDMDRFQGRPGATELLLLNSPIAVRR